MPIDVSTVLLERQLAQFVGETLTFVKTQGQTDQCTGLTFYKDLNFDTV